MNDQISRQRLIEERNAVAERFETLARALRTGNYYDECCDVDEFITEDDIAVAVEALSQPPADQWIPCSSGRMPEDGQTVVVTIKPTDTYRFMVVLTYHKTKPKRFADNDWQGEGFYHYIWGDWIKRENVIAWMPAEPYKGVE